MTALETLEAKSGHLHTVADWRIASEKAQADPASLTDNDLAIVDHFDGAKRAAAARDARAKALAPPVLETKAIPAPVATPAANVARLPTLDADDDFSSDQGLDTWMHKGANAIAAVPLMLWRGFVKTQREKRQQLEARVALLEARPLPTYQGVHRDGDHYNANAMVTKAGGLWFAVEATSSTPGTGGAWRLIVKRGQA